MNILNKIMLLNVNELDFSFELSVVPSHTTFMNITFIYMANRSRCYNNTVKVLTRPIDG